MKPITQSLIAGLAGALIATVLMFAIGRLWISDEDERGNYKDSETEISAIKERLYAYFDEKDIPYEQLDSVSYVFTYRNARGLLVYDSVTDPTFLYLSMLVGTDVEDRTYLLEKANQIEQKLKYVKVTIDDENQLLFHIEQYVDCDTHICELMDCMLFMLRRNLDVLFSDTDSI